MSEITGERFRRIVDSYGASPSRWPDAEREAAQAFMARNASAAESILREAALLDRFLAGHRVEQPGSALVGGILADASARRSRHRWWTVIRRGSAFAGLGMAGVLSGALAVALVLPMTADFGDDDGAVLTAFHSPAAVTDEGDDEE
ncbi:hypothetical protein [Aureimonas leprariae]|uniref:Uncharacterized protein n=1 Tax=Plantimonas leprariae TaxID=2615207 RepID=A0A7V7PP36_9HYPH|nr:hypothetical protein [Aureimonas leprariae]KAB0679719.1 hypothetical protein F6X38_10840 [Aureimonas leprariae]